MKLRQLFEAPGKTAVAAFGRMNPPTIGHEKLVDAIRAQKGDHYLFLSQTQKPKDNPLPFSIKKQFVKAAFPDVNVGHESVRTPIQMLQMLEKLGYTDVIYIAGSDRVEQFEKLFNDYNGKEYNFNSIKVVSAGERDPDADGAEGMSASKMRAAAAAEEKEAFAQGLPKRIQKDWENVYSAVRTGMGIKELEPTEDVSPEDEKKFHNELDDLVHKYFGDSPDEEKMKKKMRKVKEADLVLNKANLVNYMKDQIMQFVEKEDDVDKLSKLLIQIAGKTVKARGDKRYTISNEDVKMAFEAACKNGMYYCSTDKKMKCRKGPKQSRG